MSALLGGQLNYDLIKDNKNIGPCANWTYMEPRSAMRDMKDDDDVDVDDDHCDEEASISTHVRD